MAKTASPKTAAKYWLVKSEPETYSIDQFKKEQTTAWTGVRNYQARNFMKEFKKGDRVLFYHSGKEKAIVGLGVCKKEAYLEPTKEEPETWVQVDLTFESKLSHPVPLAAIKATPGLSDLLLVRNTRLSVMPIPEPAFELILKKATTES